jgi:hypothetical protein
MNRRGFVKSIVGSAAVLMANRAIGDGSQLILARERGWWMGLYGKDLKEMSCPGYRRVPIEWFPGDPPQARAYFGPDNALDHWHGYMIFRDGVMLGSKIESYGLKTRYQTWQITVDCAVDYQGLPEGARFFPHPALLALGERVNL